MFDLYRCERHKRLKGCNKRDYGKRNPFGRQRQLASDQPRIRYAYQRVAEKRKGEEENVFCIIVKMFDAKIENKCGRCSEKLISGFCRFGTVSLQT